MKKITFLMLLVLMTSTVYSKSKSPDKKTENKKEEAVDQQQLNYGYALMYQAFDSFQALNHALTLKKEAQQVNDAIKDLTDITKNFKTKLDELKKDYPNLDFEKTGRPKVLEKKGKAQGKDRLSEYLPLVGLTGKEYERSLVLFLSFALNELKFISQELGNMETNEGLKKFLNTIQSEMTRLEDRMVKLLNEKYFKENYYKPQEQNKKD
jgi:uncharacterized protein (DUF2164 family)